MLKALASGGGTLMRTSGAYGERLGRSLRVAEAPCLMTRTLRQATAAITQVKADDPPEEMSGFIPREDAFLVALQLRAYPRHLYWEDGRQQPLASLAAGCTTLYDLKRDPRFLINAPFHSLHVYLPAATLNAIAEETGGARADTLRYAPGTGIEDPVVRALLTALQPALARPAEANDLFVSSVLLALTTHVATTYGDMTGAKRSGRGGLSRAQRNRAETLLRTRLDGRLELTQLAAECGLSTSHFARAFRHSFGTSPHRWLTQRRIELAQRLLIESAMPIAEIAVACGFADQSHFTRIFARHVGASPAAWRRTMRA